YVQLRDAAQEGALYGSMNPLKTQWADIETRARAASDSPVDLTDSTKVNVSIYVTDKGTGTKTLVWKDGAAQVSTSSVTCEGHGIEVLVHYDHKIFMPFMPQILQNNSIPLNATVTDTILSPICPPPP
ncbi:MAG TPA: hypothetical protein VFY83_10385, partial [Anaerolineales bacterium]|nr:hypothetical protein [Anaerolineales bacterium]